jgi:hypothetical protein
MTARRSNADIVLEAVRSIHNSGQIASREAVREVTRLKQSVVDDRLSHLVDIGELIRAQRGIFAPAYKHKPSRIISVHVTPDDGTVVIEIGNDYSVVLSPDEHRTLAQLVAGAAVQHILIAQGQQMAYQIGEVGLHSKRLRDDLNAIREKIDA